MTHLPEDHPVRHDAVHALEATLFLEASAGTGKTTLLVDRVVELVTSGTARMDQIAAITFTEAAAAELRDRVSQAFDRAAFGDPHGPAAEAALVLDSAAVTTLHGFARQILAEQPFAVGLPPLFEVADASGSRVAFQERWDEFVNELLAAPANDAVVTRALSCGMSWDQLKAVAQHCDENWDLLQPVEATDPPPAIDGTRLAQLLQDALDLGAPYAAPDDALTAHLRARTAGQVAAVRGVVGEIDLLQVASGMAGRVTGGQKGKIAHWRHADGRSIKEEVLRTLREAETERSRLVESTKRWAVTTLFGRVVTMTLQGAAARRQSGRLTFHDLLVLACELARDHPAARQELHDRYTHVLIDEFQDTDPIQAELALYLSAARVPDGPRGSWTDLPVDQGRLFFVGDPKQSIYRFRRADIELFLKVKGRPDQRDLQLTTNFRSRPAIVAWVNAVFGGLFGAGIPQRQPAYQPMVAFEDNGQDNPLGLPPVLVLGQDAIHGSAAAVRRTQAEEVVAAIATMHGQGWTVGPEAVPMRYDDVAILVRTRTGLPVLEEAFRAAGVPYRLESSSLVYQSDEVQQLLAVLRAIDDPNDSLAVLAALRSPAFGCGDDDLLIHQANGGRWEPRRFTDATDPVEVALTQLRSAHEARWWKSVSALVTDVVADRRLMDVALAAPRARESWRRVRYLIDQARIFDEMSGGDLRAFLRWVGHQQDEEARVTEAILPETDDDAVRVLTMHAAKGLEFPVTALLGLGRTPVERRPPVLFTGGGCEVTFRKDFGTPDYEQALMHEWDMERLELHRLLYVAATRARDVLIVSLHREAKVTDSLATQLLAACQRCPELWADGAVVCGTDPMARRDGTRRGEPLDDFDSRSAFIDRRAALLARGRLPRTIAATGVKGLQFADERREGGRPAVDPLEDSSNPVQRRGRAGTAVGRAVHAVLQVVDLATGEGVDALARAQSVAEGIAGREKEVADLVRSALDSDLIHLATDPSHRFWRELYVGLPVGERVLEGFIDLLIETPDGLIVVDYKTDRVSGDDDDGLVIERYALQGASYALAVSRVLRKPVTRCSFLLLRRERAHEVGLPDLERVMGEAELLLTRVPA